MNLGELLSELRENILYDRSQQVAGSGDDRLWSDITLVRYIDEAHQRFARQSRIIRDASTTAATEITLVTGQTIYPLHPSVLAVMSAKLSTDVSDMARAGHSSFDTFHQPDSYYFDPSSLSSLPPGKPVAYSTDEGLSVNDDDVAGIVNLRVYPEPTSDYNGGTIKMRVVRSPIVKFDISALDAEPEIPPAHHMDMLDWAAYLALRVTDRDAGDMERANMFRTSFEDAVAKARQVAMRKMFAPVQWGFGRNAWSWER